MKHNMTHNMTHILWAPCIWCWNGCFWCFHAWTLFHKAGNTIMHKYAQGIIRCTTGLDTCGCTCFCGTSPDWHWCPADFIHPPFDLSERDVFLHRPLLGPTIPLEPWKRIAGNCFPYSVISDFVCRLSSMSRDKDRSPWGSSMCLISARCWKFLPNVVSQFYQEGGVDYVDYFQFAMSLAMLVRASSL